MEQAIPQTTKSPPWRGTTRRVTTNLPPHSWAEILQNRCLGETEFFFFMKKVVQSHLPLLCIISQAKSCHFNRNWEFSCQGKKVAHTDLACFQVVHVNSLHRPIESCLFLKWLLCEQCYVHCYTINNGNFHLNCFQIWIEILFATSIQIQCHIHTPGLGCTLGSHQLEVWDLELSVDHKRVEPPSEQTPPLVESSGFQKLYKKEEHKKSCFIKMLIDAV